MKVSYQPGPLSADFLWTRPGRLAADHGREFVRSETDRAANAPEAVRMRRTGEVAAFFTATPGEKLRGRSSSVRMKLWQGILFSVLFHAGVFLVPGPERLPPERPCEALRFVIVQEGRKGSTSAETQNPATAGNKPPTAPAPSLPISGPQPEESKDNHPRTQPLPLAEDTPWPTLLAGEVPKPLQPVKKPPVRPVMPPRREKPAGVQSQPQMASEDSHPTEQTAARHRGPESSRVRETGPQDPDARSSISDGEGRAGQGPSDLFFGTGDGPRFLTKSLPRYPRLARELGKEGTVLLQLTINERGQLMNVEVLRSAGSDFDEEAVRAVKNSTFKPAVRGGKPIMCRARLPIRFVLRSHGND